MPPPAVLALALAVAAVLVIAGGAAPALTSPARSPRPPATGRRHAPLPRRRVRRRRTGGPGEVVVASWCDRVAGGVRAGSSLTQAVLDAGTDPDAPFDHVAHVLRRGRPLESAFRDETSGPDTAVGLAAPVVATCAEVGGPAAHALERVAATLLARAAERDDRRTASAQARLSARVLTVLPLGVLAILVAAEPSIRAVLATPAGACCVVAGGTLDLCGWWWMRRLIGAGS
jgi:tight adherence protein B